MSQPSHFPSEDDGRRLHAELSSPESPCAPNRFALAYLQPLCDYLAHKFPHAAEDLCAEAATEAILSVIRRPDRYDGTRLPLASFLCMAAKCDLKNAQKREARHAHEILPACVEEPGANGNKKARSADGPSWDDSRLVAVIGSFSAPERITFELLKAGERRTRTYAKALGWDEQRTDLEAAVKRIKDTVKVRLTRAVGGRS